STLRRPPVSTLLPYTTLFRSVEVIEGRARGVLVDEGEGGRGHVLGVPSQPAREALDEVGLARAEVAVEGEHVAGAKVAGEALTRSEEHTSELQSRENVVCRLL